MASSILELAWTEMYNAFGAISTATDPGDGGGAYRNTIAKVYKRPMRLSEIPQFPSICIWPMKPTVLTPNTARTAVQLNVDFMVDVFVGSYSDEDATTGQTQLSEDFMSLYHDVMRVALALTLDHVNSATVKFVIDKAGIQTNLPIDSLGRTMGGFFFKLPTQIRWYGRGLIV